MRPTPRLSLLAPGILLVLVLSACGGEPSDGGAPTEGDQATRQPPAVSAAWRGTGPDLQVSVWEMHCAGCELEVEGVIEPIPGVAGVRADWETSEVRIDLEEDARRDEVIARIREAIHEQDRLVLGEDPVER